jgi:N-methylhydantoinase A/oxoprolinase/acetone carboxylase beta subunit
VAQRLRDGGHAILSEYREYERGVTAAVNASVQPVLDRYLSRLREELSPRALPATSWSCRATAAPSPRP